VLNSKALQHYSRKSRDKRFLKMDNSLIAELVSSFSAHLFLLVRLVPCPSSFNIHLQRWILKRKTMYAGMRMIGISHLPHVWTGVGWIR
jgi:hypothetical protein